MRGGRGGVIAAGCIVAGALAAFAIAPRQPAQEREAEAAPWRVLVFSRTAGFRHASIPAGIKCIEGIGAAKGFAVDATEDGSAFTEENLARYEAVVFLNTTGDVLDEIKEGAFEAFIRGGGGYVGVHSAADTEYEWAWYGKLVGAWFRGHPPVQEARVGVVDREHPATSHLPAEWVRRDEWYDYRALPAPEMRILLRVDETTYEGGGMGEDHPIGWCHEFEGGRAIYTGGGHTAEAFEEEAFVGHLTGAILWAAGREKENDE